MTDYDIVCTEDSFRFLADNFDPERELFEPIRRLKAQGWVDVPDWMPVGLPGYEWTYPCCMAVLMRPAPRPSDRLRYEGNGRD